MGKAKDIIIKVIPSSVANRFIEKNHYSGKVVSNSNLHFGAFLNGKLHGVMSYGSPLDKSKVLGLVKNKEGENCLWNEMIELNRMAFDDTLPRNSESRCIAVSVMLIRKNAPHIKWILSFSDATQCGDGTIYRASGFYLTKIKENKNICRLPSGECVHKMTLESSPTQKRKELGGKSYFEITGGRYDFKKYVSYTKAEVLTGYQLRYIYLIDKNCKIDGGVIPFEKIDQIGAGMYMGCKVSVFDRKLDKREASIDG